MRSLLSSVYSNTQQRVIFRDLVPSSLFSHSQNAYAWNISPRLLAFIKERTLFCNSVSLSIKVTFTRVGSSDMAYTIDYPLSYEACDTLYTILEGNSTETLVLNNAYSRGDVLTLRLSRVLRLGSLSVYDVDLQASEYRSLGVAIAILYDE